MLRMRSKSTTNPDNNNNDNYTKQNGLIILYIQKIMKNTKLTVTCFLLPRIYRQVIYETLSRIMTYILCSGYYYFGLQQTEMNNSWFPFIC